MTQVTVVLRVLPHPYREVLKINSHLPIFSRIRQTSAAKAENMAEVSIANLKSV